MKDFCITDKDIVWTKIDNKTTSLLNEKKSKSDYKLILRCFFPIVRTNS